MHSRHNEDFLVRPQHKALTALWYTDSQVRVRLQQMSIVRLKGDNIPCWLSDAGHSGRRFFALHACAVCHSIMQFVQKWRIIIT